MAKLLSVNGNKAKISISTLSKSFIKTNLDFFTLRIVNLIISGLN